MAGNLEKFRSSGATPGPGPAGPPVAIEPEHLALWPDLAEAIRRGVYRWTPYDETGNGEIDYYGLLEVAYCANIVSPKYQYMNIFVPAGFLTVDGDGNVTGVDRDAVIGGYRAETAPILFENHCGGWRSGAPEAPGRTWTRFAEFTRAGIVYVSCGARSRDAVNPLPDGGDINVGKAPSAAVDQKAAVIYLRANAGAIPGDPERIISTGGSGAGQMSTALGATGDMPEYYPYLFEAGALGVSRDPVTGEYESQFRDGIYGCHAKFPIADIGNADLAYAWWRAGTGETGVGASPRTPAVEFSEFQLALQQDLAEAYVDYINSLGLKDASGNALTLTGLRAGSYYDAILNNLSAALHAFLAEFSAEERQPYIDALLAVSPPEHPWLRQNADGSCTVTDLDGFMQNYGNRGDPANLGTVFARNKNIPGFDTMDRMAENDAFGRPEVFAVHYSANTAEVIRANYARYSTLEGFDPEAADSYIRDALSGADAGYIAGQVYLMNATQILLDIARGKQGANAAQYWRVRSGTADEHTSYSIGFNVCLAAAMAGAQADYSLVWNMNHGDGEGTSTGTLIDWIRTICK